MKNNASFVYALLLILGDFLALMAAFSVAYVLRVKYDPRPLLQQIPAFEYIRVFMFVLPLWILVHGFIGLYNRSVYERRFVELGRLLVGSFIGILVVIGYDFVSTTNIFPARLVPVYGLVLGFSFLVLFRTVARIIRRMLFKYGIGISNILFVGDTRASEQFAEVTGDTRHSGQHVLGIVGRRTKFFQEFSSFDQALALITRPIHGIVQTELYKDQEMNNQILRYAQENHVSYRFVPGNTDLFVGNIDVELFAGMPVIAVHQTALIGWGRIVKRLFDLFFTIILLIPVLPLMAVITILMKIADPRGKIFFTQPRLTRFNRQFSVYKFRTVRTAYNGLSPEQAFRKMDKPELIEQYRKNGDQLLEDPRFGRLGRFMRKLSIDELPQFFNVLKGDLSLVGPRALVPEELAAFTSRHAILSVKSGVTGLAQISGRRDINFDERRRLDIYYVQNWSFWMDLVILIKTLRVVFLGTGAK